jgi:hypothetical protein
MRGRGRPPITEERREIEKTLGVSSRRVQQLLKEFGLDKIEKIEELKLWEKRIVITLKSLQAQEREVELNEKRRKVISLTESEGYGMKIGQVVERFWDEGRTNWPTEHAGKTELQLQILYDEATSEFKERLRAAVADR